MIDNAASIGKINTVLGPIHPEQLGITSLHEHLVFDLRFSDPDDNRGMSDPAVAVEDMRRLDAAGGRTLVDQTCQGIGRDALKLKHIAQQCDIQIIASTGFYRLPAYPPYIAAETIDQLAERMIRDIDEGIDGTDVRAGLIAEIATEGDKPFTPDQLKVYQAAALAQQATGLSISAHCWCGQGALPLIELLVKHGVSSERIVVHHVGANRTSIEMALSILSTGARVMTDCIGYGEVDGFIDWNDDDRARFVAELFQRGYGEHVTISKDLCRKAHFSRFGGHGHQYLLTEFVPMLREVGLSERDLQQLLVDTPRAVLTPEKAHVKPPGKSHAKPQRRKE